MESSRSLSPVPVREALVGRLVRQVCNRIDGSEDLHDILRLCLGAALANDLTPDERCWLIAGVENCLAVGLEPMSRLA